MEICFELNHGISLTEEYRLSLRKRAEENIRV